jgi:hypothetical protein
VQEWEEVDSAAMVVALGGGGTQLVAVEGGQAQGFGIRFGKKFGPNRNGRISGKFGRISDSIR